jgi:hypothetical protein
MNVGVNGKIHDDRKTIKKDVEAQIAQAITKINIESKTLHTEESNNNLENEDYSLTYDEDESSLNPESGL